MREGYSDSQAVMMIAGSSEAVAGEHVNTATLSLFSLLQLEPTCMFAFNYLTPFCPPDDGAAPAAAAVAEVKLEERLASRGGRGSVPLLCSKGESHQRQATGALILSPPGVASRRLSS